MALPRRPGTRPSLARSSSSGSSAGSSAPLSAGLLASLTGRTLVADHADLTGEFFDATTDFATDLPAKGTARYNHGFDVKLGPRKLGTGTVKQDDFGLWADLQLNLEDEYEQFIYDRIKAGKMGFSSAAPGLFYS